MPMLGIEVWIQLATGSVSALVWGVKWEERKGEVSLVVVGLIVRYSQCEDRDWTHLAIVMRL